MGVFERIAEILQRRGWLVSHHTRDRRLSQYSREIGGSIARGNILIQQGHIVMADEIAVERQRLFAKL